MAAGNRHASAPKSVIPLLAVLFVVAVCTGLGFWQLDRADQKRTILAQRLSQSEAAIRSLPGSAELVSMAPDTLVHAPVEITGQWLMDYEILLDNQVHSGRAGCHVLTPMRVDGSNTLVLVNRGWVAWGPDRGNLPQTSAASDTISVRGRVWLPVEGGFRLASDEGVGEAGEWQRLWQNLELKRYASRLPEEYELLPFVLRMDAEESMQSEDGIRIGQQDGYRRDWFEPTDLWIHRHIAYAVQWFGLAAIAVFLFWLRRRKTKSRA